MRRRSMLIAPAMALPLLAAALPRRELVFPRDYGAHPDLRTEWWYITGFANAGGREFGYQLTFFRSRVDEAQHMKSAFAAKQLLFAHAAVTDLQGRKLWHDQRIAREGFGVASASREDTALKLRDWTLVRRDGVYEAKLPANGFSLDLRFAETQPILLQGDRGLSRKGPDAAQASYYYSKPQLAVSGRIVVGKEAHDVRGKGWLDHEASEAIMHPQAVGWDWIGMNLDDGSALTAFRLRRKDGSTVWDGGSFRSPKGGGLYTFTQGEVIFSPQRRWKSPLSQATYPVEWMVRTPADYYTVRALLDNQELDSRGSTGAIYWEGLSELVDSNGRKVGKGYLEMTGYASALKI